ncbi:MAG: hypothetical protein CSA79_01410 [Thiothrix nivea]|nr:MAG: hypothetical protein CSA79_01410 [Thiothrix nivea]
MNIQNNIVSGRTQALQSSQPIRTDQVSQSNHSATIARPPFNNVILQLLLQLIVQLLQQILQNQPEPEPESLPLTSNQQNNLKQLFDVDPNAPFGVEVLDEDGSGDISEGDTAILNGGITGGEVSRKTLSQADVENINQSKGEVPQAFTDNLQKWQQADTGAHQYETRQVCFCPQEVTRPMTVTELQGRIVNAVYADDKTPVPDNIRNSLLTVDERFAQLQEAYESGADTIDVQYDPQSGYPASVFIDQSRQIADEEVSYSISNLQRFPRGAG